VSYQSPHDIASLKRPSARLANTLIAELKYLANLLMPAYCQICNAPLASKRPNDNSATPSTLAPPAPTNICAKCAHQCQQKPLDACPLCGEPYNATSTNSHLCSRCIQQPPPFIWLKTAGIYNDTIANAIQQFKYHGKTTLATGLAQCMIAQLRADIVDFAPDIIVPVPLHITRLRERGFNQSLLLARHIGKQLTIPVSAMALQRIRPTSSQAQLNAHQRRFNLHGAFAVRQALAPQKILLVDDIVTTSATVRSCAKILYRQGHFVAVIAMGRASLT
jgi:ComF family protein